MVFNERRVNSGFQCDQQGLDFIALKCTEICDILLPIKKSLIKLYNVP